jgi:hypothetical protein
MENRRLGKPCCLEPRAGHGFPTPGDGYWGKTPLAAASPKDRDGQQNYQVVAHLHQELLSQGGDRGTARIESAAQLRFGLRFAAGGVQV